MKCPWCGGTAYAYACEDENGKMPIKCPWCGYSEVQTNEDWFCQLVTEEKAKAIVCLAVNSMDKKRKGLIENDVSEIIRWLKAKHHEQIYTEKAVHTPYVGKRI